MVLLPVGVVQLADRVTAPFAANVTADGVAFDRDVVEDHDVVVLDRDLPGLHGDTLCQMIAERHGPLMVLMLTAAHPATGSAG